MAQLVKLQDYVSRYEIDIFRYAGQYTRLKKQRWDSLKAQWEASKNQDPIVARKDDYPENTEKKSILASVKGLLTSTKIKSRPEEESWEAPVKIDLPPSLEDLKKQFLDELFHFQLRWASSTLKEKSFIDRSWYVDEELKYFLQQFPDNYLVLYRPILLIQHAPVELDIIMVSPVAVWCITVIHGREEASVFSGSNGRFWTESSGGSEKNHLNPLFSLNRSGNIVKSVLEKYDVELPVKKVILSQGDYIEYSGATQDVQIVDRRHITEWHQKLKKLSSPMKHVQLTAAKHLINLGQKTSYHRPEWEDEPELESDPF